MCPASIRGEATILKGMLEGFKVLREVEVAMLPIIQRY